MDWDFSIIWSSLASLEQALLITVRITVWSILIGTTLGTLLGVLSVTVPWWLKWPARVAVEVFLALPVLVLIIWIYYCLPLVEHSLVIGGEAAAVLGLGTSLAGFVAQIVRGGINSVPLGQIEVAYCTGMSKLQTIRYIVLPQALSRMWPALVGQYITCYKMSTLASVVAVPELLHTAGTIIAQTYRPLEIYTAIAAIFLVTLAPINYLSKKLEQTARLGGIANI